MFSPISYFKTNTRQGFTPTPIVAWLRRVFTIQKREVEKSIVEEVDTVSGRRLKKTTPQLVSGFTLVELLVSVSIFAVITSIVLANHGRFNSNISLTNLAYDIALSVRQAQSYGLNSRANQGVFANEFGNIGYGVNFRSDWPSFYRLYVDIDNRVGPTTEAEILERYDIQRGNTISEICVNVTQSHSAGLLGKQCSDRQVIALYAQYTRPNPEPYMRSNLGFIDQAIITVSAPNGNSRDILITQSGQVSVSQP